MSIKTYYEKTYSLNPGGPSLCHGFVVLHDSSQRTRGYDHNDDAFRVSCDTDSDHDQHYRNAPEHYGGLLI